MENITENNRLIADFMGLDVFYDTKVHHETAEKNKVTEMKYHSDWNWLMPVVEKIESLVFTNDIYYNFNILGGCQVYVISSDMEELIDVSAKTKLLSVYEAVIEFIKWYNLNK